MRLDEPQFRRQLDRLGESPNLPAEIRRELENLRIGALYLLFDLEATRREAADLRALLEALDDEPGLESP